MWGVADVGGVGGGRGTGVGWKQGAVSETVSAYTTRLLFTLQL